MNTELYIQIPEHTRAWVVGDVHGHVDALIQQLKDAGFDWEQDVLIGVGDWIDGGSQSLEAIKLLTRPNVYSCLGNHEMDLLIGGGHQGGLFHESRQRDWFKRLCLHDQAAIKSTLSTLPLVLYIEAGERRYCVSHAAPPHAAKKPSDILCGLSDGQVIDEDPNYEWSFHGHQPVDRPTAHANHLWIDTYRKTGKLTLMELRRDGVS